MSFDIESGETTKHKSSRMSDDGIFYMQDQMVIQPNRMMKKKTEYEGLHGAGTRELGRTGTNCSMLNRK